MPANPDNRLLSRTDVEEEYGITRRFLEVAAVKGGGPRRVMVGRLCRYRRLDIEAWIEAQSVGSRTGKPGAS